MPHANACVKQAAVIGALIALLAGCAQQPPTMPDVQGLVAPTPGRPLPVAEASAAALQTAQRLTWVQHPGLRQTIAQGLTHNRDLRAALSNIERARSQYGITSAAQLPTVAATAQGSRTAAGLSSTGQFVTSNRYAAQLAVTSFELDLWGRVRNLNEAALQQFLQSEVNQLNVQITLVADVTNAWLNLAANEARLTLARDTLTSREKAYQLTERMHQLGGTSGLVLAQNRVTVETARGDVAAYTAQVAKDRNALNALVGSGLNADWLPTADTLRGDLAAAPAALLALPAELPSTLLLSRPDVRASEFNLQALSANVAAARAALFPTISLSTSIGTGSSELDRLFGSGNNTWSFVPQVLWPIFDGGSARAAVQVAQANRDIAVAQYEKAIQTAFREVSDSLAERAQWQARLAAQQAVVDANAQAFELSEARFTSGVDNYLTVLDAQRSLYSAQQALIGLRQSEQANRVALWKVLGGQSASPVGQRLSVR